MFQIGNFLIVVGAVLAAFLVAAQVYRDIVVAHDWRWDDALQILQFVLVLLVASIPVAMPAVFSITMALGALALSKQKAIVSRLAAIEEMAGVDILCTDKTGTLTKNQLKLGDPILLAATDPEDVVLAGALASRLEDHDPIDTCVIEGLKDPNATKPWTNESFTPFDPVTKRTEATVKDAQGKELTVAKGAPQAIVDLTKPAADVAQKVKDTVAALAAKGSRALAVARSEDGGKTWSLLGILPMFDPPRDDSKATIDAVKAKGIAVKMITGDDTAIAIEVARELGMGTNIVAAADAFPKDMDPDHVPAAIVDAIEKADGYARVFPEHKYAIVKALQIARPPRRHDRRRRQRRPGPQAGRLRHRRLRRHRRRPRRRGADPDRPRPLGDQLRDRRGPAHLRPDHHLHHLPGGADHRHHGARRALDGLPRLPAADRDHDRHHVAARRHPDHDHRLRPHAGEPEADPLEDAAPARALRRPRLLLRDPVVRPAADRPRGPLRPGALRPLRPAPTTPRCRR